MWQAQVLWRAVDHDSLPNKLPLLTDAPGLHGEVIALSMAGSLPASYDKIVHVGTWSPRLSRSRPLVPPSFPFNTRADSSSPAVPVSMTVRNSGRVDIATIHGNCMHVATLCDSQNGIGNATIATGAFYTCNCVFIGTDNGSVAAFLWQPKASTWSCVGVVPPPSGQNGKLYRWSTLDVTEDIPGGCFHDRDPRSTRFLICGVLQPVSDGVATGAPVMFLRNCDVDHAFTELAGAMDAARDNESPMLATDWPMFRSTLVYQHELNWPAVAGAVVNAASVCKLPPLAIQLLQRNDAMGSEASCAPAPTPKGALILLRMII